MSRHNRLCRLIVAIALLVGSLSSILFTPAAVQAAGLMVVSATPTGTNAPLATQIQITFNQPINASTFAGSINGAPIVPTQIAADAANTIVTVDPGELEYDRTYNVIISGTTLDAAGDPLGTDYPFNFTVQANPNSKRPTTTINLPSGPLQAGQTYAITGAASGYVWERDSGNPLNLRHWDVNGNNTGGSPMLHPAALYFPGGMNGYQYWLFYTPYPPEVDENPVLMRSNDGVNFTATGVSANPLFTYNYQPPFDMQNLADPEAFYLGKTWMLFYEMETSANAAQAIGEWMKTGGNIGVAFSDDGMAWQPYGGRYIYDPGNPPTGFPANGNPIVVPALSEPGDYRSGEMAVIFKDGQFHMWRTVLQNGGVVIAHDTATDPRGPWTRLADAVNFGAYQLGPHPDVVYDAKRGLYLMIYLVPNGPNVGQLGVYTAADPAGPWTPHPLNPIFRAQSAWEGARLYRATLVQVNGQWYMYYSGNIDDSPQIGLAREVSGVRRVEVSTNGGTTWQSVTVNANGAWSYNWAPPSNGNFTITARVTDDFMQGSPAAGVNVTVGQGALPAPSKPILLITNSNYAANPYGRYMAEILRSEGLVEFQQVELAALMSDPNSQTYLNAFRVVLLAETGLTTAEEQILRNYVSSGGNLIAMRPDHDLADLFGLTFVNARAEQSLQFLAIDTTREPGAGIVSASVQYHGAADNYTLNGAASLANLWNAIDTPAPNPAVTLNAFGSGQAAAFTFDLAKSIILTRQGNPAWKDSEGDGLGGYRPEDMFFRTNGDKYLAPERTRIPQADEEQRFLANVILSLANQPLPRLWYLPGQHKSLIVNTGDAEGDGGPYLQQIMNDIASYGGRFTSYMMESGISATDPALEATWRAAGHETGPHVYGGGPDTCDAIRPAYQNIVNSLLTRFGHGARTARSHTIDWCGWSDMAAIEANNGTGLDVNYYHYLPPLLSYGDNANGYFTGSGLPQKFSDESGTVLPIFQALTEWPDEWFADNGFTANQTAQIIQSMLTAAEKGYYSAFVANIHHVRYYGADSITHNWANQIWAYARDHGIPLWSAEQLLDFVTARNASDFSSLAWNGTTLAFDFSTPSGGRDLTLMIPSQAAGGNLFSIAVNGSPIAYTLETIKGREYALFTTQATSAHVVANFGQDTTPPVISNVHASDITDANANIVWTTDELATSRVDYGFAPAALSLSNTSAGYVTAHTVGLPGLVPNTRYYYRVTSLDHANNLSSSDVLSFTSGLPRWVETTVTDFSDGIFDGNIQVINDGDGAFSLGIATGFFDHFLGTALDDTRWLSRNIIGQPISVTVANSWATTDNATYIRTNQPWFQRTVEGQVTLGPGPNAHFGWATTVQGGDDGIADPHWMIFSVSNNQVMARTRLNDGQGSSGEVNTVLSGIQPGVPHNFRIVWKADNSIEFWVDGYLQTTHNRAFTEPMRVYLTSNSGQTGSADWVRVTGDYAANGVYESSVFDSGGVADFNTLAWMGDQPAGTTVDFETRTSVDGISWSPWAALGSGGFIASPIGQYLQYRASLATSSTTATPRVDAVTVTYLPGPDTSAPIVVSTSPIHDATDVSIDSNLVITYNEPISPTTFNANLSGGAALNVTFENGYRRAVLNPTVNLNYLAAYTVTIAAGVQDLAGNATTAPFQLHFTTAEQLFGWVETTVADFADGTVQSTQVAPGAGDGEITLAAGLNDHFLGTTLDPVNLTRGGWGGGAGDVTLAGSQVTVTNSSYIRSVSTFNQSVVEGWVRFGANGSYLNFGVGTDLNAPCTYLVIGPDAPNTLRVQTYDSENVGGSLTTFTIQTTYLPALNRIIGDGQFHYLKVAWTANEARYYIDNPNTPVATHTNFGRPLTGNYFVWLSSSSSVPLAADQISAGYASSGSYISDAHDVGAVALFRRLSWVGGQPSGSTVAFETRTSDYGNQWSAWEAIGSDGGIVSPIGQFIQYRATLDRAGGSGTPIVQQVVVSYAFSQDTTPPIIAAVSPPHLAVDVPLTSNIVITYNEPINPATFNVGISGGITFTASFENGNRRVVIDPNVDLPYRTQINVSVAPGVQDLTGNATSTAYQFSFTTVEQIFGWTQTTAADFESGTLTGAVVGEDGNGEVRLRPAFYDRFLGTAPGSQWASGTWGGAAYSPQVSGSVITHTNPGGGAYVRSVGAFPAGTTIQARLKFSRGGNATAPYMYFGFAGNGLVPWALFGTGYTGDQLYTSVYPGYGPVTFGLGDLFDQWHDYKIVWNTSSVEFWVDNVLRHTENVAPVGPLNIYFSASGGTPASASVAADWVRVEEYGTTETVLVDRLNDTFAEVDGPATNWVSLGNPIPSAGIWSVINHEYVHDPAGTSYHPAVLNNNFPVVSDFVFETRAMSPDASPFFGMVWGVQDNGHYYMAQFYPGASRVYLLNGWANFSPLASPTFSPVSNQWYTIRIEGQSGTYRLYIDGSLAATVTDSTFSPGRVGLVGYGGNMSRYDDVIFREFQSVGRLPDPGVYTSIVYDAQARAEWLNLNSTSQVPVGTLISFQTHTSIDGVSWSNWTTIGGSGNINSPIGRYIQYRANLSTTIHLASPALESVVVSYRLTSDGQPPILPNHFYGEVHIDDPMLRVGDVIQVAVPGVAAPFTTTIQSSGSTLIYALDVPGDVANTPEKEGGTEGEVITFTIGSRVVASGIWHSGTNTRLDFHSTRVALQPGWNLVSFNLMPVSSAITDVLSSLAGQYDLVYAWDAPGQTWLKYDDIAMSGDTLVRLDERQGFWLHLTTPAQSLTVYGQLPTTTSIPLSGAGSGWNLVGYPAAISRALPDVLRDHGVGTDFSLVYAYHANEADPWKLFDRNGPPFVNDLSELAPGWGYWIQTSITNTWTILYPAP